MIFAYNVQAFRSWMMNDKPDTWKLLMNSTFSYWDAVANLHISLFVAWEWIWGSDSGVDPTAPPQGATLPLQSHSRKLKTIPSCHVVPLWRSPTPFPLPYLYIPTCCCVHLICVYICASACICVVCVFMSVYPAVWMYVYLHLLYIRTCVCVILLNIFISVK